MAVKVEKMFLRFSLIESCRPGYKGLKYKNGVAAVIKWGYDSKNFAMFLQNLQNQALVSKLYV